jgi:hypothetical protein
MTEGFCPLRLLLKVHGNLSLKIIGKSDLSIFYPYDFESLSDEQLNIGIFEASQMMYSVISIIKGEIMYPDTAFINISLFQDKEIKDIILFLKILFDIVYTKETITLVNSSGNADFSPKSDKKTLDLLEYNVKKIKSKTFYELRYALKMMYFEEYEHLPRLRIESEDDYENVLSFSYSDFYLFEKDNHTVPLGYFKILAKFMEHIENLHYRITKEKNKKDT